MTKCYKYLLIICIIYFLKYKKAFIIQYYGFGNPSEVKSNHLKASALEFLLMGTLHQLH